jgi:hypothetical protein
MGGFTRIGIQEAPPIILDMSIIEWHNAFGDGFKALQESAVNKLNREYDEQA